METITSSDKCHDSIAFIVMLYPQMTEVMNTIDPSVVKNVLLLLVVSSVSWFILSGTVIEETTT